MKTQTKKPRLASKHFLIESGYWMGSTFRSNDLRAEVDKKRKLVAIDLHAKRELLNGFGPETTDDKLCGGITLDKHKLGQLIEKLQTIHNGMKR